MPQIRPVSDLRNNFSEISRIIHETQEPVFLTKNGHGDMVVMSIEQYEIQQYDAEVFGMLKMAETEAKTTTKRHSHEDVMSKARERIKLAKQHI